MRPTKTAQSALRYPLTHILGTEANVRILRVLALSDVPIGVSELARQASLQASGVARICEFLEDFGVIESIGRGERNRQYRRLERFRLWTVLVALFTAEKSRAEGIVTEVRNVVVSVHPVPRSAWLEGAVAAGDDRPGSSVAIGILTAADKVGALKEDLWRGLLPLQKKYDVSLDLNVYSAADIETMSAPQRSFLERIQLLWGAPPLDLLGLAAAPKPSGGARSHAQLDRGSRDLAGSIADVLRRDPSLVERAQHWLSRRMQTATPGEQLELDEWLGILTTMSVPRIRRLLVEDSPRMTRLRQSIPFVHVLEDRDRKRILGSRTE